MKFILLLSATLFYVQFSHAQSTIDVEIKPEPFFMIIEDIFDIKSKGVIAVGRIESGTLSVGDSITVFGFDGPYLTVCNCIEMFRVEMKSAEKGDNVGVCIEGITKEQLKPGMVFGTPGTVEIFSTFQAELTFSVKPEGTKRKPLPKDFVRTIKAHSATVSGEIQLAKGAKVQDDVYTVQITLESPIFLQVGSSIEIIEESKTIGAGKVTVTGHK